MRVHLLGAPRRRAPGAPLPPPRRAEAAVSAVGGVDFCCVGDRGAADGAEGELSDAVAAADQDRAIAEVDGQDAARRFLSKIPGYVDTPVTYWANGMYKDLWHANGMHVHQEIDSATMMQRVSQLNMYDGDGATIFLSGTYAFDGAGNLKAMGSAFNYRYDGVSRLVESRETWGTTTYVQKPTFDAWGNIQALETGPSGGTQTLMTTTSSASNRLATTGTLYDPAGNLTSWNGGSTLAYDRLNRMRRFTAGTEDWVFAYTADDERLVSIRIAGNGKIWTVRGLDNQVLREWRAEAGVHSFKDYVWTGRELLAEVQRTPGGAGGWTETTLHAGTDHLSSVRKMTDASGHVAANHIYYPFGKELTSSTDTERIKWAGYERDLWNTSSTADDLDYLHARHYNPQLGRFLQIDPLAGKMGRPQTLNRYAYVTGNPLKYVDPDGRVMAQDCHLVIGEERGDPYMRLDCSATSGGNPTAHIPPGGEPPGGPHWKFPLPGPEPCEGDDCKEPPDDGKKNDKPICKVTPKSGANPGYDLDRNVGVVAAQNSKASATYLVSPMAGAAARAGVVAGAAALTVTTWDFKAGYPKTDAVSRERAALAGNIQFGAVANEVGVPLSATLLFAEMAEMVDFDEEFLEPDMDLAAISVGWQYWEDCK